MTNPSTANTATTALIRALDVADAMPGASDLRTYSYDLLRVSPGDRVVDVGCGTGRAVAELAERGVASTGVDVDDQVLAEAHRRWPDQQFQLASTDELPLPDGSVAGYRADKVLHQLAEPTTAIAEAQRVLAPAGRIVLIGPDWDSIAIDSDHPAVTRILVHARADTIPAPRVARSYRQLLLDAGFADVTIEVRTAILTGEAALPMITGWATTASEHGAVTAQQADTWLADQSHRATTDRLLLAFPLFIAAGTRE